MCASYLARIEMGISTFSDGIFRTFWYSSLRSLLKYVKCVLKSGNRSFNHCLNGLFWLDYALSHRRSLIMIGLSVNELISVQWLSWFSVNFCIEGSNVLES